MSQTMPNQGQAQARSQKKITSKKYYFDLIYFPFAFRF